jgi:hypothetical protein
MTKDIVNYNDKGEWHGYIQSCHGQYGYIVYRATYKNDNKIGYVEWHRSKLTDFYIG